MIETFIEDLQIVRNKRVKELVKLDQAIKKVDSCLCRGEVSIISKKNKEQIIQTHYEYFKITIIDGLINIYNCLNGIKTLDYTMINGVKITKYSVNETSLILRGDLSEEFEVSITIVFKDKIK